MTIVFGKRKKGAQNRSHGICLGIIHCLQLVKITSLCFFSTKSHVFQRSTRSTFILTETRNHREAAATSTFRIEDVSCLFHLSRKFAILISNFLSFLEDDRETLESFLSRSMSIGAFSSPFRYAEQCSASKTSGARSPFKDFINNHYCPVWEDV